jgi:hypothetical protein
MPAKLKGCIIPRAFDMCRASDISARGSSWRHICGAMRIRRVAPGSAVATNSVVPGSIFTSPRLSVYSLPVWRVVQPREKRMRV